jgi:transcriptional regulator with XRE-family HTH domain
MVARVGPIRATLRLAETDDARVRSELRDARLRSGLSRETVGRAIGLPRSVVERIEAGSRRTTSTEYAMFGAVVGLDVRIRAYPAGDPIRDAGQARLLERLRRNLHPGLRWQTEVPLPIDGDRRAWDAVISGRGWHLAVEAETVLTDVQAVERRLHLKRRDGGIDHVLLLVAETARNRQALRASPGSLADLVGRPRDVLAALRAGRAPATDAIVLL